MIDINEIIAEVLRLDAEAVRGPWGVKRNPGCPDVTTAYGTVATVYAAEGNDDDNTDLIAYYRMAAPALAREVQCLRAERDAAYGAGQEAMRERAIEACVDRRRQHAREAQWHEAGSCAHIQADEARDCADAIRALEVEP